MPTTSQLPKMNILLALLALNFSCCDVHSFTIPLFTPTSPRSQYGHATTFEWALKVSELHIPGYRESKKHFILDDIHNPKEQMRITNADYSSSLQYDDGHLIHKTNGYLFTKEECNSMVEEAEEVAARMGWTTTRHGVSFALKLLRITISLMSYTEFLFSELSNNRYTPNRTTQHSNFPQSHSSITPLPITSSSILFVST